MAIIQCPNGHYYDNQLFSECPYCNNNHQQINRKTSGEFSTAMFGTVNPGTPVPEMRSEVPNAILKTKMVFPATASSSVTPTSSGSSGTKTRMYYDIHKYFEDPPGGWLVCVRGPDKGKDFCVITEKTLIGRSGTNSYKVNLTDDKISRNSPVAVIAYLPDSHSFVINSVPGGNLLVYLNKTIINTPSLLRDRDMITIGDTVLVFISFCGRDFDWDHYKVKFPPT